MKYELKKITDEAGNTTYFKTLDGENTQEATLGEIECYKWYTNMKTSIRGYLKYCWH